MDTASLLSAAGASPDLGTPAEAHGETAEQRRAKARAAGQEFEALFLGQMMAPMFENLDGGLFGGGPGEAVYRSMLVEEYGKAISRSGGIGIAEAVEREILSLQEVQQ